MQASPKGIDYSQESSRRRLKQSTATYTEETIRQLVGMLREWQAGPVGFGLKFRRQFKAAWDAFRWRDRIEEQLDVTVTVNTRVRRYGLLLAPLRPGSTAR